MKGFNLVNLVNPVHSFFRGFLLLLAFAASAAEPQRPSPLKSGIEFAGPEVRAMQADDFANPGMLWVARGEKLWSEAAGKGGKSCAACHGDAATSMKGVATRYPRVDPGAARLVNLEGRINLCRTRNHEAEPLKYESDELLGLTAYVASAAATTACAPRCRTTARVRRRA